MACCFFSPRFFLFYRYRANRALGRASAEFGAQGHAAPSVMNRTGTLRCSLTFGSETFTNIRRVSVEIPRLIESTVAASLSNYLPIFLIYKPGSLFPNLKDTDRYFDVLSLTFYKKKSIKLFMYSCIHIGFFRVYFSREARMSKLSSVRRSNFGRRARGVCLFNTGTLHSPVCSSLAMQPRAGDSAGRSITDLPP